MQTIKHTRIVKKMSVKAVAKYKIVYRLEHPNYNHVGPFNCTPLYGDLIINKFAAFCTQQWYDNHPIPEEEGIDRETASKCLCGCKDIPQLKSWFGDFLKPLIEIEGFQLVRYAVRITGVHVTKTQVLIEPSQVIRKTVVKKVP